MRLATMALDDRMNGAFLSLGVSDLRPVDDCSSGASREIESNTVVLYAVPGIKC